MTNASGILTFYLTAAYIDVLDSLFTLLTFQFHISFRQWPAGSTRIREIKGIHCQVKCINWFMEL